MAFPINPTSGQIYKDYQWDDNIDGWTNIKYSKTIENNRVNLGTGIPTNIEMIDGFLNNLSFQFNGTSYIDFGPQNQSFSQMTVCLWINPQTVLNSSCFLGAWNDNEGDYRYWFIGANGDSLRFVYSTDGTYYVDNNFTSSGTLVPNTWQFVAAVYNGSDIKLYKNGYLIGTQVVLGGVIPNVSTNVVAGTFESKDEYLYEGLMSDIRLYDVALTEDELNTINNIKNGIYTRRSN